MAFRSGLALADRPQLAAAYTEAATATLTFTAGVMPSALGRMIHDDGSLQTSWRTVAQDGQRYGLVSANYRDRAQIATLKSLNPYLKVYCYFDAMFISSTDTAGDNSGVGWTAANIPHPEWFLLTSGSARIPNSSFPNDFLADVGLAAYQNACVTNILSHVQDGTPWDGVLFDNATVDYHTAVGAATAAFYTTETAWQTAYQSFWTAVTAQLHAQGLLVMFNFGDDYNSSPTGLEVSRAWLGIVDGQFCESWTDGGAGLSQQNAWTPFRIQTVQIAESLGKSNLLHSQNTTEAGQTYALALGLCFNQGHTFADTAWPNYATESDIPEYTIAQQLGKPLQPTPTTVATGVYRRDYQFGTVLANTTNASSSSITLGGTYSGSGLSGVTTVTLAAWSGVVLLQGYVEAVVTNTLTLVASGVEVPPGSGTIYTDAATATLTSVASAAEVPAHVDAATAAVTFTAGATETTQTVDSATAALSLVTSAVETKVISDAATCALTLVGSAPAGGTSLGTPYKVAPDSLFSGNSTNVVLTTNVAVAAGDMLFVGIANRVGATPGPIISSIAGITVDELLTHGATASSLGVSIARAYQSGAGLASGTVITITMSIAIQRGVAFAFAVPGVKVQNCESGVTANTDGATTTTPSIAAAGATTVASAIVVALFSKVATAVDTATPNSGWTDVVDNVAGTSTWDHGVVEYQALTATGTPTAGWTSSGATGTFTALIAAWDGAAGPPGEVAQFTDAFTAALGLVAGGTEVYTPLSGTVYTDAATCALSSVASGAETAQFVDAAQAALVHTASATEAAQLVDVATCAITFTASAGEAPIYAEAATAAVTFTASATEAAQLVDSATCTLVNTASAVEVPAHIDAAQAVVVFTPTALEATTFVDATTAAYVVGGECY